MSFVEVITAKRDGLSLRRDQIASFVHGATSGQLPPEQLAALLMAICCRGMNDEETSWLTAEMLDSGQTWNLAADCPGIVDKHSTGGVGDTVSLILAPLLAAVGVPVAMMAGRGLGHSQGTLDKLEAIPGFQVHWDRAGALSLIERCGVALVAQTAEVAPADRVLYALRDVTGTVPSLPLIVASIMSKKLALGATALIFDVKWGSGAFRKTVPEAVQLASALCSVARNHQRQADALITDMNQPLGAALGTANEVRAAVDVLGGGGDPLLARASLDLAAAAMVLVGHDRDRAVRELAAALTDGRALAAWEALVRAHGGDPDPARLAQPTRRVEVTAEAAGWIGDIAADSLGWVAVELGAGRRVRDEAIDFGGGVEIACRLGDKVRRGDLLATLELGERRVELAQLQRRVRDAFTISTEKAVPVELVLGSVDEVGRNGEKDS